MQKAQCDPLTVHSRQVEKKLTEVAGVVGPFVLNEERGCVSSHIRANLLAQSLPLAAMVMERDGGRLVSTDASGTQYLMPELGVSGTASRADIKALIKATDILKDRFAERHTCTSADLPDLGDVERIAGEELFVKIYTVEAAAKTPMPFKVPLRRSRQLGGKNKTGHRKNTGVVKRGEELLKPMRMKHDIVVSVGDDVSSSERGARVASYIETWSTLVDVLDTGVAANCLYFGTDRAVVDDNDLIWRPGLLRNGSQTACEISGAVSGTDDERNGLRVGNGIILRCGRSAGGFPCVFPKLEKNMVGTGPVDISHRSLGVPENESMGLISKIHSGRIEGDRQMRDARCVQLLCPHDFNDDTFPIPCGNTQYSTYLLSAELEAGWIVVLIEHPKGASQRR